MAEFVQPKDLIALDNDSAYLLLISPEKIPHLVLVNRGEYFSLTYKKAIVSADFSSYLEFLKKSQRKLLFFKLAPIDSDIAAAFLSYKRVNTTTTTCLIPIKNILLSASKAKFVFELIPDLFKENLIQDVFHLNMEPLLDELGRFEMNEYSEEDIFAYIKELNDKHAQRN